MNDRISLLSPPSLPSGPVRPPPPRAPSGPAQALGRCSKCPPRRPHDSGRFTLCSAIRYALSDHVPRHQWAEISIAADRTRTCASAQRFSNFRTRLPSVSLSPVRRAPAFSTSCASGGASRPHSPSSIGAPAPARQQPRSGAHRPRGAGDPAAARGRRRRAAGPRVSAPTWAGRRATAPAGPPRAGG